VKGYNDGGHMVLTICGSIQNYPYMLAAAAEMTAEGYVVLMPHIVTKPGNTANVLLREMLDKMHKSRIDMSDAILVVGKPGRDTLKEIDYAESQSMRVYWRAVPGQ
jgi:dienelactone hydrolase